MDGGRPERDGGEDEQLQGALLIMEQLRGLVEQAGDVNRNRRARPVDDGPRLRRNAQREGADVEDFAAVRRLAFQFARQMRVAVNELEEQRDQMRQEVINRGLIDAADELLQDNGRVPGYRNEDAPHQLKYDGPDVLVAPDSLTRLAVTVIVNDYSAAQPYLKLLPPDSLYRVYKEMLVRGMISELEDELLDLDNFSKLLRLNGRRMKVHRIYESARPRFSRSIPCCLLAKARQRFWALMAERPRDSAALQKLYNFVLELGNFLVECLTYNMAIEAFEFCQKLLSEMPLCTQWVESETVRLNYYLLVCYTGCCEFEKAKAITTYFDGEFADARKADFRDESILDHAQILIQCAVVWQQMGYYKKAMSYVVDAVKTVAYRKTPLKTVINVFRLSSKILMSARQHNLGFRLVRFAVHFAYWHFKEYRRFPHVLMDYAYCLVNLDHVKQAVAVYKDAVEFLEDIFGTFSVCLSQGYEELAYALYVLEYISGDFARAYENACKAVTLNTIFLPKDHMLNATSRRMKALIMEEQALSESDAVKRDEMLHEALQLHTSALEYYQQRFGDENIFTAKNYGNLGRLYQSLKDFEMSEKMHLKAIEIKRRVVGEDDYETALSMGHLAALYTNDMNRQLEARDLYLKSAEIATKIFGETFTGLEYDYRGLCRVYSELGDDAMAQHYQLKLADWNDKRRLRRNVENTLSVWRDIPMENQPEAAQLAQECLRELAVAGYT